MKLQKVPQIKGLYKHDLYGYPVKAYRRHKDCTHDPPCQMRFRCNSKFHVGPRATPWCAGCDDELDRELGGVCDSCWQKHEKQKDRVRFTD